MKDKIAHQQRVRKILGDKYKQLIQMRKETEIKELLLENVLEGKYVQKYFDENLPHILILRKWNSWYPSFFDTIGGCYALVLPSDSSTAQTSRKMNVVVIDPGFKFLDSLRRYNIEAKDINSVVVTHFHPDHTAGLAEFLTLTQKLKHRCDLYLNETAFKIFRNWHTEFARFKRISESDRILVGRFKRSVAGSSGPIEISERLYIEPKKVYHRETGDSNHSLGLRFIFEACKEQESGDENLEHSDPEDSLPRCGTSIIGLLGDTDGNDRYFPKYVKDFSDVNLLILHLGTLSAKTVREKYAAGDKHLYDIGLILLLNEISEMKKEAKGFQDLESVVISEFGLEMANVYLLLQTMNLFSYPEEWQAFLNLFNRITETSAELEKKIGKGLFEFEKTVFSKICLFYILGKEIESFPFLLKFAKRKRFGLHVPMLIGLQTVLLDFEYARKYCSRLQLDLTKWVSSYWQNIDRFKEFATAETQEALKPILFNSAEPQFISMIDGLSNNFVKCLVENLPESITATQFKDSFENFVLRTTRNNLRAILRKEENIYGLSEMRKILPFVRTSSPEQQEEMVKLKDSCSQVLWCSSLFLYRTLEKLQEIVTSDDYRSSIVQNGDPIKIFDGLQDILRQILETTDTSVLIGDLGLDIVFDVVIDQEERRLKYLIKARAVDQEGIEDYRDIRMIRSKEIVDFDEIDKNQSSEKYLSNQKR